MQVIPLLALTELFFALAATGIIEKQGRPFHPKKGGGAYVPG
jgi:hypothetical protein